MIHVFFDSFIVIPFPCVWLIQYCEVLDGRTRSKIQSSTWVPITGVKQPVDVIPMAVAEGALWLAWSSARRTAPTSSVDGNLFALIAFGSPGESLEFAVASRMFIHGIRD